MPLRSFFSKGKPTNIGAQPALRRKLTFCNCAKRCLCRCAVELKERITATAETLNALNGPILQGLSSILSARSSFSLFLISYLTYQAKLRQIVEIYFFSFWVKLSTSCFFIIPQTFREIPAIPPSSATLRFAADPKLRTAHFLLFS